MQRTGQACRLHRDNLDRLWLYFVQYREGIYRVREHFEV
jgi:hypothetical protein